MQRIRVLQLPFAILIYLLTAETLLAQDRPVGWDPDTIWDGPNAAEPVALFLLGIGMAAPISFFIIRSRRRRAEQRRKGNSVQLFKD
jgi:hypothetical protein